MPLARPFVTVDQQTKDDNTVTIRHRDSMEQDRISISKIKEIVSSEVS
jgi:glycyl-tRNA synthetase